MKQDISEIIKQVKFDECGLVTTVTQDFKSGEVLMVAWMNAESLEKTLNSGQVYYWSRSRRSLWRKGETSGHTQSLKECFIDCDGDTILLKIEQVGVACHTGKPSCFFSKIC